MQKLGQFFGDYLDLLIYGRVQVMCIEQMCGEKSIAVYVTDAISMM